MPLGRHSHDDRMLLGEFLNLTADRTASDAARCAGIDPQTVMNWRRGRATFMRRSTRLRVEAFIRSHSSATMIAHELIGRSAR
jgi:hypothetical protein